MGEEEVDVIGMEESRRSLTCSSCRCWLLSKPKKKTKKKVMPLIVEQPCCCCYC